MEEYLRIFPEDKAAHVIIERYQRNLIEWQAQEGCSGILLRL